MMMIKIALTNLEQTSKCLGRNNAEWEAVARTVVAIVLLIASLVIVNIFAVAIVTLRKWIVRKSNSFQLLKTKQASQKLSPELALSKVVNVTFPCFYLQVMCGCRKLQKQLFEDVLIRSSVAEDSEKYVWKTSYKIQLKVLWNGGFNFIESEFSFLLSNTAKVVGFNQNTLNNILRSSKQRGYPVQSLKNITFSTSPGMNQTG